MLWLTALVINEVAYLQQDSGWVEIYNESGAVVDLSHYSIRTGLGDFPLSGVLAGGEYRVFYVHFRETDDSLSLLRDGDQVDSYSWSSLPSRGSVGRLPNGSGEFRVLFVPTPGRPNDIAASLDEQSWGRIKALFGPGKRR